MKPTKPRPTQPLKIPKYLYLLYDERAILGTTDEAIILSSWDGSEYESEEEIVKDAKIDAKDHGNALLCAYDENGKETRLIQFNTIRVNGKKKLEIIRY